MTLDQLIEKLIALREKSPVLGTYEIYIGYQGYHGPVDDIDTHNGRFINRHTEEGECYEDWDEIHFVTLW